VRARGVPAPLRGDSSSPDRLAPGRWLVSAWRACACPHVAPGGRGPRRVAPVRRAGRSTVRLFAGCATTRGRPLGPRPGAGPASLAGRGVPAPRNGAGRPAAPTTAARDRTRPRGSTCVRYGVPAEGHRRHRRREGIARTGREPARPRQVRVRDRGSPRPPDRGLSARRAPTATWSEAGHGGNPGLSPHSGIGDGRYTCQRRTTRCFPHLQRSAVGVRPGPGDSRARAGLCGVLRRIR
jgi:hypothetical protein